MGNADSKLKEATEKAEQIALEKENLKEVYEKAITQKNEEYKQKLQDLDQKLQSCLTTKENEIEEKVKAGGIAKSNDSLPSAIHSDPHELQ